MASVLEFLQTRDGGDWVRLLSLPLLALALLWGPLLYYRFATWRMERKLGQRDVLFADERIELAMSVPAKPEPLSWKAGVLSALFVTLGCFAIEFVHWRGVSAVWVLGPLWCWILSVHLYRWRRYGLSDGVPKEALQGFAVAMVLLAMAFLVFMVTAD